MTEREALLVLNNIPGLGNIRIRKLLEFLGSALSILKFRISDWKKTDIIPGPVAENIIHFDQDGFLKREYELMDKEGVRTIAFTDQDYPQLLKEIPDAPVVLYVKGDMDCLGQPAIAVVGSRRASLYGMTVAEKFAGRLAELGITIISGMARGIDSASHRGALKAGGRTAAVLGCGLSHIYPPENKKLRDEIIGHGCVISEFAMEIPPLPHNFPRRNRIVSGLALGVIVVEAKAKSGALITSNFALEQGREVFAVPGPIDHPNSFGVHHLIKQGAKLIGSIEDVLEELQLPLREYTENASVPAREDQVGIEPLDLNLSEQQLFTRIGSEPIHLDALADSCSLPVSEVMAALIKLEVRKFVRQLPGKMFVR